MDKLTKFLTDWAKEFVKNRNLITKSIVSMDEGEAELIVKHRDREQRIIVKPFLGSFYDALKELGANPEMHLSVVTFNSDKSFKALIDNWEELTKHRNFSVYFANPFSQMDKRWIIFPYTHAKICDSESLELGLRAMFETVDRITEDEAMSRI